MRKILAVVLAIILCAGGFCPGGTGAKAEGKERVLVRDDKILIKTTGIREFDYNHETLHGYEVTFTNVSTLPECIYPETDQKVDGKEVCLNERVLAIGGEHGGFMWSMSYYTLMAGQTMTVFLYAGWDWDSCLSADEYINTDFAFTVTCSVGKFWYKDYHLDMETDLGDAGEPYAVWNPPKPDPERAYADVWTGEWVSTYGTGDAVTITDNGDGTVHAEIIFEKKIYLEVTADADSPDITGFSDNVECYNVGLFMCPGNILGLTLYFWGPMNEANRLNFNGDEIYYFVREGEGGESAGKDTGEVPEDGRDDRGGQGWEGIWMADTGDVFSVLTLTGDLQGDARITLTFGSDHSVSGKVTGYDGASIGFESDEINGFIDLDAEDGTMTLTILTCTDSYIIDNFGFPESLDYFPANG